MEPKETSNRISRRSMIKRVGAATAVAWTAPVLSSLRTPAFADYGVCRECALGDDFCFNQPTCGTAGANPCSCLRTEGNACACHACVLCSSATPCENTGQCPPGWVCALSCCSANRTDFRCHPQCTTANPEPCFAAAAGTATSMGAI